MLKFSTTHLSSHNERKVTCKHPVSGVPSQDNCIFVVNEHLSCGKLVPPDKPPEPDASLSCGKLAPPGKPPEPDTRSAPNKAPSEQGSSSGDKKERPLSTMSEASNYTGGSDYSTFQGSPAATTIAAPTTNTTAATTTSSSSSRPSRSSKKIHNFGKRSNSIKRNTNAPAVKSNWLYKQDSAGMKLWKKRWFVLSDMCLFYYRDDKEEGILGSILLPSFHVSMLSVDDHISRKYAFKATHPNMRTYYFCTDTAKDMEAWMKVMTDAALVHTEPIRRLDKLKADQQTNNLLNHHHHRSLTRPEIQNNERNRTEPATTQRQHSLSRADERGRAPHKDAATEKHNNSQQREYYTLQRDGERYSLRKDGVSYTLQKDGERLLLHKDGEKYTLRRDGERYALHRDSEVLAIQRDLEKYAAAQKANDDNPKDKYTAPAAPPEEKYAPQKDGEKYLLTKDGEKYALQKVGDRHALQKDQQPKHVPQKEVKRQLSLREERYGTLREGGECKHGAIHVVDKYGTVREVKKYSTLREGGKYATLREGDRYATLCDGEKYGFQRDPSSERTLTKINSIKLQPAQAAAIAAAVTASRQGQAASLALHNGSGAGASTGSGEQPTDCSPGEVEGTLGRASGKAHEGQDCRGLSRTNSMQQLEHWVRTHRTRGPDDDARSITSYQTLPRNMPSHRPSIVPRYPEGYRTLPRNSMMPRPDSVCSVAGSPYDRALRPASTINTTGAAGIDGSSCAATLSTAEKRRSMRDDTMWQLYEWQQRQAFSRQSLALPSGAGHYGTLPSTKTMCNISEHAVAHSIPTSPSHGSLALYSTFSPPRQQQPPPHNPSGGHSEVSSPVFRGDVMTLDRRHRTHIAKYGYPPDRRSMPTGIPPPTITPQALQGKTPEELTLLLIKLRRQQAELNSLREHTVAQLMTLGMEGPNPKTEVLSHHLQRNLVYLDSQTKENEPLIFMIHTMIENSAPRPQLYQQVSPEDYREGSASFPPQRTEEVDVDTKLSRLCEQDKAVRMQEEKLQQLHREKHTLETALLSASQELSEQSAANPTSTSCSTAMQSLLQQRDVLQSGLLSTCRELTRVTTELERSWREYDKLETDVTLAKTNLLEQLEALGSPQTEPPSQRHVQIQKELWRIQDVMEALAKNKPERRSTDNSFPPSRPLSSISKNEAVTLPALSPLKEGGESVPPRPPLPQFYDSSERPPHVPPLPSHPGGRLPLHAHRPVEDRKAAAGSRNGAHSQAPDYRLYKSEPELTTVKEEGDEANGEDKDKTDPAAENKDTSMSAKVPSSYHPVGIVQPRTKSPMSPPESCTIASYVTLRKTKKPEARSDRPRSAADQMGAGGEREVGRARMSVEEQLERMRRNQQAALREKKTPSRSPSFNKDNPCVVLQSRVQVEETSSADPAELQAALQQLEQSRSRTTDQDPVRTTSPPAETDCSPTSGPGVRQRSGAQEVQRDEEAKPDEPEEAVESEGDRTRPSEEAQLPPVATRRHSLDRTRPIEEVQLSPVATRRRSSDRTRPSEEAQLSPVATRRRSSDRTRPSEEEEDALAETDSADDEVCESQKVVILDLCTVAQRVEIVNPQPLVEEERRNQELTNASINAPTENSLPAQQPDTLTPEPNKGKREEAPVAEQTHQRETQNDFDSYNQLAVDDIKHNNNNNNIVAAQTLTLVNSDT